jgi:hypothetical protein
MLDPEIVMLGDRLAQQCRRSLQAIVGLLSGTTLGCSSGDLPV